MAEDDDGPEATAFRQAYERAGWIGVVILADALRDAREKVLVDRVEHYLESLIVHSGVENPTLTVRDVRRYLFEIPQ